MSHAEGRTCEQVDDEADAAEAEVARLRAEVESLRKFSADRDAMEATLRAERDAALAAERTALGRAGTCPLHDGKPLRPRVWRCDECHARFETAHARPAASASPEPREPWYGPGGSVEMLPAAEVTRRRRAAAMALDKAQEALTWVEQGGDPRDAKVGSARAHVYAARTGQEVVLAASPEPEGERAGPEVTVKRSCKGCKHLASKRYEVQGDSGFLLSCSAADGRRIGDSTWATPDWCPASPPSPAPRCPTNRCGVPPYVNTDGPCWCCGALPGEPCRHAGVGAAPASPERRAQREAGTHADCPDHGWQRVPCGWHKVAASPEPEAGGYETFACPDTGVELYRRRAPPEPEGERCTGLSARWCPVHGDCKCEVEDRASYQCPLHSPTSSHGPASPPSPVPEEERASNVCRKHGGLLHKPTTCPECWPGKGGES